MCLPLTLLSGTHLETVCAINPLKKYTNTLAVTLIGSKLRRGDPFTEDVAGWNPPNVKDRRKKSTKKSSSILTQVLLLTILYS